ncbi:MAG: DUF3597 domain-containing protein [Hyphomicrobiaceae bacterium]
MSIFGSIMSSIFGTSAHAETAPAAPGTPGAVASAATPSAPAATAGAAVPSAGTQPTAAPMTKVDVAAVMDKLADEADEDLDWKRSIVDLMKLLKLDSSLSARRELAAELHYTGDTKDTATMNVWLHKQVMTKLAENGGVVPAGLGH